MSCVFIFINTFSQNHTYTVICKGSNAILSVKTLNKKHVGDVAQKVEPFLAEKSFVGVQAKAEEIGVLFRKLT